MSNFDGTREDYWRTIGKAAEDVADDMRRAKADGDDEDQAREDGQDSWADSLTTYTHDALTVLRYTENDEAALEEGVYDLQSLGEGISSIAELYTRLGWFA